MRLHTYPVDREALRRRAAIVEPRQMGIAVGVLHQALELLGGLGLSAPQLGVSVRAFVARGWPDAFINPQVLKVGERTSWAIEGCLSIPGTRVYVARPTLVKLRSWRSDGTQRTTKHRGADARVVLHELDHLEGVLITDYIPGAP